MTETEAMVEGEKTGKKETVYYFVLNVATKAITYVLLLAFANLFSLVDYGQASFAIMAYTIVSMLIQPGFASVFIPYYIQKKDVHSIFYFTLVFSMAAAALALVVSFKYALVWPFALAFLFGLLGGAAAAIMRAERKYHLIQATEMLFLLSSLLLTLLWRGLGDRGIVYAFVASTLIVTVSRVWFERKPLAAIMRKPRFSLPIIKEYLFKGFSVLALLLSFDFLGRTDSVLLGFISTFENVARYNISSAIAGVLTAISMSVSMFLLTRTAELGETRSETSGKVFERSIRIAFSLNLVAAIALVSLIHLITRVFFKQYVGIEPFVAIISASTLFYALYMLYVMQLIGRLTPERAFKPIFFAALANLVLDVALIPLWGVYGICFATLAASIIAFTLVKIRLGKASKALVYASPLLVFAAFFARELGLLLIAPAVFLLLETKSFEKSDWLVMKSVLKEIKAKIKI